KNVALGGERRLADPVDALAAHMGERRGVAVGHEQRHAVAADAGHGAAAVRHPRRGIVRAARAEKRRALNARHRRYRPLERFQSRQALIEWRCVAELLQARHDGARHHGRRQFAGARQQDRAGLVGLADDARPPRRLDIVEKLDELVLDEAALLFDDQNVLDALRKGQRALRLERPDRRDFVAADAERAAALFAYAEFGQGLPRVQIGLAGGDDTQPRLWRIDHHVVELIGAREGLRGGELWAVQAALLLDRPIHAAARPADVQAA